MTGSYPLDALLGDLANRPARPLTVSLRTLSDQLEAALMSYTHVDLEVVLRDELRLTWPDEEPVPTIAECTKRELIQGYVYGWDLPRMIALARRVVAELDCNSYGLVPLLEEILNVHSFSTRAGSLLRRLVPGSPFGVQQVGHLSSYGRCMPPVACLGLVRRSFVRQTPRIRRMGPHGHVELRGELSALRVERGLVASVPSARRSIVSRCLAAASSRFRAEAWGRCGPCRGSRP